MIEVKNLALEGRLSPISFKQEAGEIVHLVGANGCGKSTLLSLVAKITTGHGDVLIDNLSVSKLSISSLALVRAYLSQHQQAAFNLAVYQYLFLSASFQRSCDPSEIAYWVNFTCEKLGLLDKLSRYTNTLSGGEWQRVRIAGIVLQVIPALNPQAKILILDEPAVGLDPSQEVQLFNFIHWIAKQGISVLMSNHDLNRALSDADKVLMLKKGNLKYFGTPEEIMTPEHLETIFNTKFAVKKVDYRKFILPEIIR